MQNLEEKQKKSTTTEKIKTTKLVLYGHVIKMENARWPIMHSIIHPQRKEEKSKSGHNMDEENRWWNEKQNHQREWLEI